MANAALVDLNVVFDKLKNVPLIANNMQLASGEDKTVFNNLVYTKYEGDSLKLTAQCSCGKIKGDFREGEYCDSCYTECKPQYSGEVESLIWMLPDEKIGPFILPIIWHMLCKTFRMNSINVIKWLCDPYYRVPTKKMPDKIIALIQKGHKRGYKYFVENFFTMIDDLVLTSTGRIPKRYQAIYDLLKNNRDKIFCKALPVPSKTVLVLERNNTGNYFDKSLFPAIDAVILASEMGNLPPGSKQQKYESKMVNIIDKMATFIENFSAESLTGKTGIFRKHYFAARLHFTARQVITSNHGVHNADELIMPWTACVNLFLEHLRSKLLKAPHYMNFLDTNDLLNYATNNYHPLIDQLLEEVIITDSPYKGFPCLFSRAPILTRGSIQFFYITGYTKNPHNNSIRVSPLVLVMPNADFDGKSVAVIKLL